MKIDVASDVGAVAKKIFSGRLEYNSTVRVPSGTEAVFFMSGQAVEVLRSGEHTVLGKRGLFLKKSPNEVAEIYAVDRIKQFSCLWGVGGVSVRIDGETRQIGANGEFLFTVDNSLALLRKFGMKEEISAADVRAQLKGIITGVVKEQVIRLLESGAINIGGRADELKNAVEKRLMSEFLDAGLFLDAFLVEDVQLTDEYEGIE